MPNRSRFVSGHFQPGCRYIPWMYYHMVLFFIYVAPLATASVKGTLQERPRNSTDIPKGLFPTVVNLATLATITANATCGLKGPEIYCKLVEHGDVREPQCSECDAKSPYPEKRHPIQNAIDGTDSWWQSPSLQNGKENEWVTITLDLHQVYQVTYVIIKSAISPRPGNWILERSVDGHVYKAWQYYAISDPECWDRYGIQPTLGIPHYRSDDEVICTSYYSKLEPMEGGEIHTSLVNGRPGVNRSSETLREFTKARFIRLRLQKIRTLHADLMTHNADPQRIDRSVTRRYFYSIKDISVGGHCLCFGHAENCPVDVHTKESHCVCEHNTCGDSCEMCCPLYNQKPWRPGSENDGAMCEKCQCFGHADECFYDQDVANRRASLNMEGIYEGGGVCKNCKHHTAGYNCEQCEDGYYRSAGVSRYDVNGCVKCECSGFGATGNCIKDDTHLKEGYLPGQCICKENYAGEKCDRCARGYRNYPRCEPCPCHYAGNVEGTECVGQCTCKANVMGDRCDRCKLGYYDLSVDNPLGCSPCFCFGVTKNCTSSDWGTEVVQEMEHWTITDLYGKKYVLTPFIQSTQVTIEDEDVQQNKMYRSSEAYYWLAPDEYMKKKHYAYGAELKLDVEYYQLRGDVSGVPIAGPEVVLEGNGMLIGYNWTVRPEDGKKMLRFKLREPGWFRIDPGGNKGEPVTRSEFTMILSNLKRFLIRAKYHTIQREGSLYDVLLTTGSKDSGSINKMTSLEKCICPPGYEGLSCEICSPGYRRVNNTLVGGFCEKCDCHNHAASCDPYTGLCHECLHETTGPNCEACKPGYYGNARRGTPEDCQRCACPLTVPSNNFSPLCTEVRVSQGTTDYVCTACPEGYEGRKCERCADGYFGNPMIPGHYCQPCSCGRNTNTSVPGFCDRLTGRCVCMGATGGWNCDQCLPGHYGNPQLQDCRPCNCHPRGSASSECDTKIGQCLCQPNFVGRTCDRCADGYGEIDKGCRPCACNPRGAVSPVCDQETGQCQCKQGVFGLKCTSCMEGHYGFSEHGCRRCGCDHNGSEGPQCDVKTGQCRCKPRVIGRTCDRCDPGFWNKDSGHGCDRQCNCNVTGSLSVQCEAQTGQCDCKPGVGGQQCDQCLPSYFDFSGYGCRKCDPCDRPGHVCDPRTGRCICPANTGGISCQNCAPGAWGYDPIRGCKLCNCNSQGSETHLQCDPATGQCRCLEGYGGQHCDQCLFGYHNFPSCRKCHCNADGTETSKCRPNRQCQCDESGQCPCKTNVEGRRCDRCKPQTFGLSSTNPDGCFKCFCFGKSSQCSQSNFVWSQQKLAEREVAIEVGNTRLERFSSFQLIPGDQERVLVGIPYVLDQPLYWSVASEFNGDKILSYNGELKFKLEIIGSSHYPQKMLSGKPLVVLQGNHRIILEHFATSPSDDGYYHVRFHENKWQQSNNPEVPVTRSMMMVALQKVQRLLIRATDGADVKVSRLRDPSVEVAVQRSSAPVAEGIEICRCPYQYSGTSCQDPAPGFYRKRKPNFLESPDIIDLVGWAELCPCSNRSRSCDPETGECKDCTGYTTGRNCEQCIKGFYGNPALGPCLPCACPFLNRSLSDTCVSHGQDYVCTSCQSGYAGRHCERCADGYYGNPLARNGICRPCECSPFGSVSDVCDKMTGQCRCFQNVTGRDCSTCLPLHVLIEQGRCQSCDDKCTGLLLTDIRFLHIMLDELSSSIPKKEILVRRRFDQLLQNFTILELLLEKYMNATAEGFRLLDDINAGFDLATKADILESQAGNTTLVAPRIAAEAEDTLRAARELLIEVQALRHRLQDLINDLRGFGLNQQNIAIPLDQARRILRELQQRNFDRQHRQADDELRKAIELLEKVAHLLSVSDNEKRIKDLLDRIRRLENAVTEMEALIQIDVQTNLVQALSLIQQHRQSLGSIKEMIDNIENVDIEIKEVLTEARKLLYEARNALVAMSINLKNLPKLVEDLRNYTEEVEHHRGILSDLNPKYREKYVKPLQRHALELMQQARVLERQFSATKNTSDHAVKAAEAYKDIADALRATKEAAERANKAARETHQMVFPDMTNRAKKAKDYSEDLLAKALQLKGKRVPEIQRNLRGKHQALDNVDREIKVGQGSIDDINKQLDALPRTISDDIGKTREGIQRIADNVGKTKDRVDDLSNEAGKLKQQFDKLTMGTIEGLDNITKMIEKARADMRRSSNLANAAEKQASRVADKHNQLTLDLEALKSRILLARQKASTIRVSLSANENGHCIRSYKPDIQPSTTNHITLIYAIKTNAKNSLLFFIKSKNTSDFMAIEMINRKIRFLWNAGRGTKVIEHGRTIEVIENDMSDPERWYKVEVNRIGVIATLSVVNMKETRIQDPAQVTGSAESDFTKLDLDPSSAFFIGGIPDGIKAPKEIKAQSFAGCLYELKLDRRPVGLWNFLTNSGCGACKEGVSEQEDTNFYQFFGEGYAILPQIRHYEKYSHRLTLSFKSLDEDALLLFCGNSETGAFISLELHGGYIVYQFNLSSAVRVYIKSKQKHNTGEWVRMQAGKDIDAKKAFLQVGYELPVEKKLSTDSSLALDLRDSFLYYGGVPPNFTTSEWPSVNFDSYYGCLGQLHWDSTVLGLSKSKNYGIQPGCKEEIIRSISFKGNGYLEMPGQPLHDTSSFSFTLKTKQANATLMVSTFKGIHRREKNGDEQVREEAMPHYYSISLLNGFLDAKFFGGVSETRIVSEEKVNDNMFRTITITRERRRITLKIDDKESASARLAKGTKTVEAPTNGGLFFGGKPTDISLGSMVTIDEPFRGVIEDAVFNHKLLNFSRPLDFTGVAFGRRSQTLQKRTYEPTMLAEPVEQCAEMSKYTVEKGAVKFGDALHSHIQLDLKGKQQLKRVNFIISLNLRTYYPNGLIAFARGKRKTHYFAIMLIGGKIIIEAKGNKMIKMASQGGLNDGQWHNITIDKSGRTMVLSVDDHINIGKTATIRKHLPVKPPLYVGGVPEKLEVDEEMITESFKGCIRHFKINDKDIDLAGGKQFIVRHCITSIEPGAYFGGDSYAIYAKGFILGLKFDMQLEFKTTRLNGVFMSYGGANGGPSLSLELKNGQVIASADNGDGLGSFTAATSFASKYDMCDGKWHMISLNYNQEQLTLKVDSHDTVYGLREETSNDLETANPLYIGGLPEYAPIGTLQIRDNFVGCLRNVAINDQRMDWVDMAHLQNVLPNSCPTF